MTIKSNVLMKPDCIDLVLFQLLIIRVRKPQERYVFQLAFKSSAPFGRVLGLNGNEAQLWHPDHCLRLFKSA